MAYLNPADTLPTSSRDALELFDERFNAAQIQQAEQPDWVSAYGESSSTPALETRYPMSILNLKFQATKTQEGRFRTIGEKDTILTVSEFDDGVEVELLKLLTNSFVAKRWSDAPGLMVKAERSFVLKMVAAMIEANETCGWDDLALFHDAHLANPVNKSVTATFDNLQSSAKNVVDLANIEAEITAMLEVLDINGDTLGVMPDTIFVPRQKWQGLKNLLKQDFVPNAAGTATMRNPYNDAGMTVVPIHQFTDANDWYLADSAMISAGVVPWIVSKLALGGNFSALENRYWDESSDRFKSTGCIAVSRHIWYGKKPLYPHALRKIVGA